MVWTLLVLATIALFVGSFALWVRRQLLDTDNWVTTSSQLISNQQIDKALSSFLVDQVITAPGVSDALSQIRGERVSSPRCGRWRPMWSRASCGHSRGSGRGERPIGLPIAS